MARKGGRPRKNQKPVVETKAEETPVIVDPIISETPEKKEVLSEPEETKQVIIEPTIPESVSEKKEELLAEVSCEPQVEEKEEPVTESSSESFIEDLPVIDPVPVAVNKKKEESKIPVNIHKVEYPASTVPALQQLRNKPAYARLTDAALLRIASAKLRSRYFFK